MESTTETNIITAPLLGNGYTNGNGSCKGGLRTLPFIIANEAFEKAANYGLAPNMILYFMQGYGFELVVASTLIYYWNAITNLTPVIGAFIADAYVGRYFMIAFGSITCLLGMFLLWLTTIFPGARPCDVSGSECTSVNVYQLALLISSLSLMAVGAGGIRSSSLAFGADQLVKADRVGNAGIVGRFLSWYYFCCTIGVVIAMTLLVYVQDHFGWRIGYGVPALLMLLSAVLFFLASSFYAKQKATASSLVSLAQVLVASWKKRQLSLSSERTDDMLYYHRTGSRLSRPTEKLWFLNKACVISSAIDELAPDGTPLSPWRLCSVDQVEEFKPLVKVIPMWSTGVMMSVVTSHSSWPTLLAKSMDRHLISSFEVPAGSFSSFAIISLLVWIALYEGIIMLAAKVRGKPARLSVQTRMGLGLLLSIIAVATQGIVESFRRKIAIEEGLSETPEAIVNMSAWWLLIHSFLSGGALAFFSIAQNEFFLSVFPNSMSSVATNLYGVGISVASIFSSLIISSVDSITKKNGNESWVSSNINKAHFDYFCWLLVGMGLLNFIYYMTICNRAYGSDGEEIADE